MAGEVVMCDKSAFREASVPMVKTAEQLYKEWWQKQQEKHDKTESEFRTEEKGLD